MLSDLIRGSAKEPKEYKIEREKIMIKSVESEILSEGIGFIKINTFENQNTAEEMEKALNYMKSKNIKGIILDVRNNGGGLLQNAIEIGSMFLKEGVIVYTIDREGKKETISTTGNIIWNRPVVMLINDSSASASEILAGALHDNKIAELVGTKSFGKASVQNVKQLEDGSAVLLTVAKYLTPNGTDISKKGIEPDYLVEVPTHEVEVEIDAEKKTADDIQVKKAIQVLNNLKAKVDIKNTKKGKKAGAVSLK